jgi:signal transduction histidine kinase
MYLQQSAAGADAAPVSLLPCHDDPSVTTPVDTVRALCHDMRQPLTALRILASEPGSHPGDVTMTALLQEVAWLETLVDLVLGSPTDSGPLDADLAAVVTHATQVAFAGVRCKPSTDVCAPVLVRARGASLERAVLCLLDNAIRAAGEGGHVWIEVTRDDRLGRVVIEDDGPGIGRLAPQHSLGLTTVRAILADCQGMFSLRDRDGGGAVVTMEVPVLTRSAAP